jgi:plasmid stabilization system protein ParE
MLDHNYRLRFSINAFKDIIEIQTYTEMTFGVNQREIYQLKIDTAIKKLLIMPSIGRFFSEKIWIYNVEKHCIMYTFSEEKKIVEILRIVHQKMNLDNLIQD